MYFFGDKDCILSRFTVETRNSSNRLFFPFEISFHAFLAAEVKDVAGNFLLYSRSFGNICLAIRILNKFFWLRLWVDPFLPW